MMETAPGTDPGARARRPPPAERRTRALDAFIDLTLERGAHPRPEEVAERADVSIASLYRYFTDLDELRHDAVARLRERYPDLFTIPEIGIGDRQERIAAFVTARLALHETLHPLQLLARANGRQDPAAQEHLEGVRTTMTDQIRRHFGAELQALGPTRREDTVAAIAVLTSVESWEQFRRSHDRTPAQARRAWIDAIDRLLPLAKPRSETHREDMAR
jgi:AcrR family transcriptional regulator